MIGHCLGAAGGLEAIATVKAITTGWLHPSINQFVRLFNSLFFMIRIVVSLMVYLSLEDKSRDLYLFINSPGGEVISGMGIFDIMQIVEADVQTVCVGLAASMGSLLLVGGEITKRLAFPHAWRE